MGRMFALSLVVSAFLLGGCAMEQYHFPVTQDKVPTATIVTFSEKYPNDVIKAITEQKMFDGKVQYTIVSTASKTNAERTTYITADGAVVCRKM